MMLEADGIQLSYGLQKVLQDIYLRLETGEIVGILGLNGSGKSSLFQIMFGTRAAYSSSLRVDGQSIHHAYRNPSLMRYLPQFHFIPSNITVSQSLRDYEIEVESFLSYAPMFGSYLNAKSGDLSGGMIRIWECLLILLSPSAFVLLDEPFSSVSPIEIQHLKKCLLDRKRDRGVLISDHYYRDVLDVADRVYLLKNHRLKEVENLDDLPYLGYLPTSSSFGDV